MSKAKEFIGKLAIRTAPTSYGDYSYTDSPLLIVNATDTHIVYRHAKKSDVSWLGEDLRILNPRFCDDNWIDYLSLFPEECRAEAEKGVEYEF